MIVLDAKLLIAYLNRSDAQHGRAHQLLVANAAEEWGASAVTLAEALVAPARQSAEALARGRAAVQAMRVREFALPVGSAVDLAEVRAGTGLTLPDCIVLVTAEARGASIATLDERLARAATGRGVHVV